MRRVLLLAAAGAAFPVQGRASWQSALDPQGPGAKALSDLFWIFTAILTAVWILTMVALLLALRRRRAR